MGSIATPTSAEPAIGRPVFASGLIRPWIIANTMAFTIGGAVGGGVLRAIVGPWFGSDVSAMEAGLIQATGAGLSAAVFWTLAGSAQWLVLRHAIRARWWVPATALGAAAAAALGGFSGGGANSTIGPDTGPVPPILLVVLVVPLMTLFLSAGQWLILRREAEGAGPWLFVNAAALLAAGFIGLTVAKMLPSIAATEYPSARALAVVGAVSGPIYAGLTWALLATLRRRRA